jgi:hypothetical protein
LQRIFCNGDLVLLPAFQAQIGPLCQRPVTPHTQARLNEEPGKRLRVKSTYISTLDHIEDDVGKGYEQREGHREKQGCRFR